MTNDRQFTSYEHQDLDRKKIVKYASQYDGVDMTQLIGADDSNFSFLVRSGLDSYELLFWNRTCGMMTHIDEDPVRAHATTQLMLERAYPVFDSIEQAEQWSIDHNWSRGPFPAAQDQAEPSDAPKSPVGRDSNLNFLAARWVIAAVLPQIVESLWVV